MSPIIKLNLPLDHDINSNIFPEDFVSGPTIYHGICEIYDKSIEEKGFITGYTPFRNEQLEFLVRILERLGMGDGTASSKSPKHRISKYLMQRSIAPLSFTFSAYESLFYASDERKGGQIFMAVRDAINWVRWGISQLLEDEEILINELERRRIEILHSRGAVYAISVDEALLKDLKHGPAANDVVKTFEAAMFYGTAIPVKNIKAVIYVPIDFIPNHAIVKSSSVDTKYKSTNDMKSLVFKLKRNKFQ